MKFAWIIVTVLLLVTLTLGCLDQAQDVPEVSTVISAAANTTLRVNSTSVIQGEFAQLQSQLNMTRGSGLHNKKITWAIDNVEKGASVTLWGIATYNLTVVETRQLSTGKHIVSAVFAGDEDYTASKATGTLEVRTAPTPTPTPTSSSASATAEPRAPASITLKIPSGLKFGSSSQVCTDATGSLSGIMRDENVYVLIKSEKADSWLVQQDPLRYVNGTYSSRICFDKPSDQNEERFDVVALITTERLTSAVVKDLPKSVAEARAQLTIKT